jgi:hypothetical protein
MWSTTCNSAMQSWLAAAHRSPEFREKWPQFGKTADEIEPCLYDLVHVEAAE